jgi:peptide/nickel transport system ATP-binding protein
VGKAVDDVSLDVYRGEILGIAGESGCGKSTLANAILRLTRPPGYIAGGSINFFPSEGEPIDLLKVEDAKLRDIRWRNLAYVPQGSMNSLNPVMRVENQFLDAMQEHGVRSAHETKDKIPELLKQVNLDPYVGRLYPHELSGGMKQRVIIAMAIALQPDLVIADEPTTALDVNVQRMIIQTLADLRDRLGMSIIIVSHDMAVHAELVDRVAVMYAGEIVEVGSVRQVFKNPLHPYSKGLISAIPQVGGARHRLEGIGGSAPNPVNWPKGCRFAPRCPHATDFSRSVHPTLELVKDPVLAFEGVTPTVACHLYSHPEQMGVGRGDKQ